jgi:hypothetical protein|nr:MAG TPA: hypothetical protein [Caudoviricetes sp.]
MDNKELTYINNCRRKITNALLNSESTYKTNKIRTKSEIEADLKDELQDNLKPSLNVVDTFVVTNNHGRIGAWFAIVEDDKYQYQASKTFGENSLIAVSTATFK